MQYNKKYSNKNSVVSEIKNKRIEMWQCYMLFNFLNFVLHCTTDYKKSSFQQKNDDTPNLFKSEYM